MPLRYPFPSSTSVLAARVWAELNLEEGVICPVCNQHARIYKRRLHSSMAAGLIYLCRYFETYRDARWVHAEELFRIVPHARSFRGDFAKLRFWGLIRHRDPNFGGERRNNGDCRITSDGIAFVHRRLLCPSHVTLYANQVLAVATTLVDIRRVLGQRFYYPELLRWRPLRRLA